MKSKDIFIRALAEASGNDEAKAKAWFEAFCAANPGAAESFEKEVAGNEAEQMLAGFRAEAPLILAWLEAGARRVASKGSGILQ